MNALLTVLSLQVSIAGRVICTNLDFTANPGECWGILGINGSGKTTLLHTLAGLRDRGAGEIHYRGAAIEKTNKLELAKQRGILFQDNSDPFPATVLETVLIGRHPYIKSWQWETADDITIAKNALRAVDLDGMENRFINTLSGGERQRTAVAALFAQQPAVYLLDEPTNHLDIRHQIKLMRMFEGIKNQGNTALVMILHDLNLAARFCDHVLMLFGNGKTLCGKTPDLLNTTHLEELYGHPIHCIRNHAQTAFIPA
ncbi:MAG: ABC transporter ATP-binding protein [Gammaproteobacteria bacterium]|nr:ABC transporter ATP-binding protein [Gammaproteobacteria bacterium]